MHRLLGWKGFVSVRGKQFSGITKDKRKTHETIRAAVFFRGEASFPQFKTEP
jgi:hypothetical protein